MLVGLRAGSMKIDREEHAADRCVDVGNRRIAFAVRCLTFVVMRSAKSVEMGIAKQLQVNICNRAAGPAIQYLDA